MDIQYIKVSSVFLVSRIKVIIYRDLIFKNPYVMT